MFERILRCSHLVLGFFWGEIFYLSFNFSACNLVIHNLYFFLVQSWKIELSNNLFLPSYLFYCHIVVHNNLIILCISALSVVTPPFSFLILLIWFFSLFLLMGLAKGLSILFIFSKHQLLAWKRWEYQTTWPASWETCMQVREQKLELDMEQQTGSK